jgi:hypothetical protein
MEFICATGSAERGLLPLPVIFRLQADNVKVEDDMNVYLVIDFNAVGGDRVVLQRTYRVDAEQECMGPAYLFHYHGHWPSPEHFDFGGITVLRSLELHRAKLIVLLDEAAKHPRGVTTLEITFTLAAQEFARLHAAMTVGFGEFDWFADCAKKDDGLTGTDS